MLPEYFKRKKGRKIYHLHFKTNHNKIVETRIKTLRDEETTLETIVESR